MNGFGEVLEGLREVDQPPSLLIVSEARGPALNGTLEPVLRELSSASSVALAEVSGSNVAFRLGLRDLAPLSVALADAADVDRVLRHLNVKRLLIVPEAGRVPPFAVLEAFGRPYDILLSPSDLPSIASEEDAVARADRVVTLSPRTGSALSTLFPHLKPAIACSLYSARDAERFRVRPRPRQDGEPIRVLVPGSRPTVAEPRYVLAAMEAVRRSDAPVQFGWIVDEDEPPELPVEPLPFVHLGSFEETTLNAIVCTFRPHVAWCPASRPGDLELRLPRIMGQGLPVVAADVEPYSIVLPERPYSRLAPVAFDPESWLAGVLKLHWLSSGPGATGDGSPARGTGGATSSAAADGAKVPRLRDVLAPPPEPDVPGARGRRSPRSLQAARDLLDQGQAKDALAVVVRRLSDARQDDEAHDLLGDCVRRMGWPGDRVRFAIGLVFLAVGLEGTAAAKRMIRTLHLAGQAGEANAVLDRASAAEREELVQADRSGITALGWRLFYEGDVQGASEVADRMLALDPSWGEAHYLAGLGHHRSPEGLEAAIRHYGAALAAGFDERWPRYHRARALLALGRLDEASVDITRVRAVDPDGADELRAVERSGRTGQAWASLSAGDVEGARDLATAMLDADPIWGEAHYIAGVALKSIGDGRTTAEAHFTAALENGFDPFWPLYHRATIRRDRGALGEAMTDVAVALGLKPQDGDALALKAELDAARRGQGASLEG